MTQGDLCLDFESVNPTLLSHPRWPELSPFIRAEPTDRGGWRLELRAPPRELAVWALTVRVRCVGCGAPIFAVRARRPPGNKRHEHVGHGLYISVSCPSALSLGCSRGRGPKQAVAALTSRVMADAAWREAQAGGVQ